MFRHYWWTEQKLLLIMLLEASILLFFLYPLVIITWKWWRSSDHLRVRAVYFQSLKPPCWQPSCNYSKDSNPLVGSHLMLIVVARWFDALDACLWLWGAGLILWQDRNSLKYISFYCNQTSIICIHVPEFGHYLSIIIMCE